jgi:phage-related protein
MPDLNETSSKEIRELAADVRRNIRAAVDDGEAGKRSEAYAAAERAQHYAFDLKQLFS